MIEVLEVKNKKQIKDFLNLPLYLYKGNKYFVPALYSDELKMFKPDYMYYDQCETKFFVAYKDGKCVGRIQAILQKAANEKWKQKRIRFTRVDFIDDEEVSKALFAKVEEYAKEKGMEEIVGPLNFSDLEREGLLIEGFDQLNTFEEQYNFPYYQKHIENLGYKKEVDWIEHRLVYNDEKAQRTLNLAEKVLQRGKVRVVPKMRCKKFAAKYKDQFFGILDETYDKIYGTVPFTEGMKGLLMSNFSAVINMDFLIAITDENDKLLAFFIGFPAIGEILQKSNGHLYPLTLIKLLNYVKHPKVIDLGLIGVTNEGYLKGAGVVIYAEILKAIKKYNLDYSETNLNLEDNYSILKAWENFDYVQHKRRRSFVKKVGE